MHARTREWVDKAEEDYAATLKLNEPQQALYGSVCFHAQQCIEKYAKAFLTEHDAEFPRTHNMNFLHSACLSLEPKLADYAKDFDQLNDYSVDIRYPGISASAEDANEAIEAMKRIRTFIRTKLDLPEE